MIDISKTEVFGFEAAIRGLRNSRNSWNKSDSYYDSDSNTFVIGKQDLYLMKNQCKLSGDERKFTRMIAVYADILAPMYWWKEFDTYKVGTVRNSCSTMYTLLNKPFEYEDFSTEHMMVSGTHELMKTLVKLNEWRDAYVNYDTWDNDRFDKPSRKDIWYQIIQTLPSSYNTRATVMLNYEVLLNIYKSRRNHKLQEWRDFVDWSCSCLPYFKKLITEPTTNIINYA